MEHSGGTYKLRMGVRILKLGVDQKEVSITKMSMAQKPKPLFGDPAQALQKIVGVYIDFGGYGEL